MNETQLFNFKGNKVRTVTIDNEPCFVATDITNILGLTNTTVALSRLDDDERSKFNLGRQGEANVVNEYGLYELIIASRKPEAHEFKRWITHEVLPAIRKHGAYMTDQKAFDVTHNAQGLADLLQQAADQLKQKDIQIEEMKPKALFADAVSTAKTNILIGEMAKILRANGVDYITVAGQKVTMGQNHFFQWLRENGYLIKRRGTDYNAPTQMAMNKGLFKVKESTSIDANGTTRVNKTTKVTGKGQQYFTNYFLAA